MKDHFINRYSDEALQDLKNIFQYISVDLCESDAACHQVNHIREKIRSLDYFPKRNKIVDWEPWKSLEMRQMPVDRFIVYYVLDEDEQTVSVVRIFYGKRNIPEIVKRNAQE